MRTEVTRLVGVGALAAAACTAGSDDGLELDSWAIAPAPSTVVGEMDGDPMYLFQSVAGAGLMPDGRIVVADAGLSVIRVFDANGTFLSQLGGEGEGPGEFRGLRGVWIVPPDTIGAWDSSSVRITYFEAAGSLIRTVSLEPSTEARGVGSLDLLVGTLADGSVAIGSLGFGSPDGTGADRVSVERFGPGGDHLERLGETTGFIRVPFGDRSSAPIPFSPYPRFAVRESTVYHTNGTAPRVDIWAAGSRRAIEFPPADHDPELAWATLASRLDEEGSEFYRDLLPEAPRSDSIPHLAGLLVDDAGLVWTKQYDPGTDALWLDSGRRVYGGTWWVAEASGDLVATADVPPTLAPLQIVGDRALGVTVDALGVERIQVHPIVR